MSKTKRQVIPNRFWSRIADTDVEVYYEGPTNVRVEVTEFATTSGEQSCEVVVRTDDGQVVRVAWPPL